MVKQILFICKFNLFRSKFAETYFNQKINNKKIKAESAGIIEVNRPLSKDEKKRNKHIKERFGISFNPKSRGINYKLLNEFDKIIIVAEDVPKKSIAHYRWDNKIDAWKIPDSHNSNKKKINKSLKLLKKRLDKFIDKLEK